MALHTVDGHEIRVRCPICGREFTQQYNGEKYCSQTCYREARLQHEKPIAKMVLEKWKKELEKSQKRIDKLSAAIKSNDPEAMLAARTEGLFKRAVGCLFAILKVVTLLILLVVLAIIILVYCYDDVSHPRTDNAATETTATTDTSTLQVGNQSEKEQVVPPDPLAKEQKEVQAVTVPIE